MSLIQLQFYHGWAHLFTIYCHIRSVGVKFRSASLFTPKTPHVSVWFWGKIYFPFSFSPCPVSLPGHRKKPEPSARTPSAWRFRMSMIWFIIRRLGDPGHAETGSGSWLPGPGAPPSTIAFRLGHAANQAPHAFLLLLSHPPQRHRQHHAQRQAAAYSHLPQPSNGVPFKSKRNVQAAVYPLHRSPAPVFLRPCVALPGNRREDPPVHRERHPHPSGHGALFPPLTRDPVRLGWTYFFQRPPVFL